MVDKKTLIGQVAVVTGGGRGIGRQIALALAAAGAKVAVTARTRTQLDETVALVNEQGGACLAVAMDVADAEQVQAGMDEIRAQYGAIDLLVNNAGLGGEGMLPWEADVDAWWRVLEVNVRGVFLCSHAVLPGMIEQGSGRIINVGSNAGLHANPMASAYSVSKAALLRLTDSIAEAAKEHGVSVFAISPGLVLTEMTQDIPIFKDLPTSAWTSVERAGELCVYLAGGAADVLTGRYIHVVEDDVRDMVARADEIIADEQNVLILRR